MNENYFLTRKDLKPSKRNLPLEEINLKDINNLSFKQIKGFKFILLFEKDIVNQVWVCHPIKSKALLSDLSLRLISYLYWSELKYCDSIWATMYGFVLNNNYQQGVPNCEPKEVIKMINELCDSGLIETNDSVSGLGLRMKL